MPCGNRKPVKEIEAVLQAHRQARNWADPLSWPPDHVEQIAPWKESKCPRSGVREASALRGEAKLRG